MKGPHVALALAGLVLAAGCGSTHPAPAAFHVSSPQITKGAFPRSATCDGGDHRPDLAWKSPPGGTKGFVIELLDADAPGGSFTHWLLYDLPAATAGITKTLPKGSVQGYNEFGKRAYSGPCPPAGQLHHYHFYVIALDTTLRIESGIDRFNFEAAIHNHVLGKADLMATYKR